jgi:phosphoribosylformylglycinamidine (FGAM) synthase-like enzyme
MSVKVPTAKVIVALEARLLTTQTDHALKEKREAEFQETYKKWEAELKDWALARLSKAENIRTNYRGWNNTLNVDFDIKTLETDLPKMPEREFPQRAEWEVKQEIEEITNALNILRMTEEEFVNASTMKSISQYL